MPASWVLLGSEGPVGHVRLSKKYTEDLQANINEASVRENISVVATSIVVSRLLRRKGLGTILLDYMHMLSAPWIRKSCAMDRDAVEF